MTITQEEKATIRNKSAKPMLWLAIISMCMIFGGLTSAYMVRSGDPGWRVFDLPKPFYASTAILIASSLTLLFAYRSAKKDNYMGVKIGMTLTLLMGISFILCQLNAWSDMVQQKIFLTGKDSNPSGQFLYVISFAHLAHLTGGIIVLIYVCIKSFKKLYHSKSLLGLQLCSMYWHFLDLLWVYLFLFMYFTH